MPDLYTKSLFEAGAPDWVDACFSPVESGIDFLTATVPVESLSVLERAAGVYRDIEDLDKLNKGSDAVIRDFKGYKVGRLFLGSNQTHSMLVISSNVAQAVHRSIDWSVAKPTRLDVQVTGTAQGQDYTFGNAAHRRLTEAKAAGEIDTRLRTEAIINERRVETQYVGAPTSDNRMRIYDKTQESGEFYGEFRKWRIEVQCRRSAAVGLNMLLRSGRYLGTIIPGFVAGRLMYYGLTCSRLGRSESVRLSKSRRNPDLDAQLAWALDSTLPTWRRLLSHPEYRDIAADALQSAIGETDTRDPWDS